MKYFLKLNIISILYAIMIFIPLQIMINIYRISRLTGWNIGTINILSCIIIIFISISGTAFSILLTKKWMNRRKANYLTVILWIPYFIVFVYIFTSLFPITHGGDDPNPVVGLLALIALVLYPIYLLIINFITSKITTE